MDTYVIRRTAGWASPTELEQAAARSKAIADSDFPQDIRWIRSYVVAEADGSLGTVCIYQASSREAILEHAHRVGMPADEIFSVADTVVVRPDPVIAGDPELAHARDRHRPEPSANPARR